MKHLDPDLDNLYNRAQATLNQPQPGRAQEPGIGREFFFEVIWMTRSFADSKGMSKKKRYFNISNQNTRLYLYMTLYEFIWHLQNAFATFLGVYFQVFCYVTLYRRLVDTVADGGFQQVSHMSRAMYHLFLGQSLVISVSESHFKTCERI